MTSNPQSENHHPEAGQNETEPSTEEPTSQSHAAVDRSTPHGENAESQEKVGWTERIVRWWRDPFRVKAGWTDKAIVLLTLGIVFLGFMQWLEMRDSGKQTDKIIAADERMATAMEGVVGQASASLVATIEQNRLDQRAWIGVVKLNSFDFKVGPNFAVPFDITNSGKTPALRVTSQISLKSLEKGKRFVPTFPDSPRPPKPSISVIQPQMHMTLYSPPTNVSATQFGDIENGRGILYAYGRIGYEDVFGRPHETTFCVMYWAGLPGPIQCDTYNTAN